MKDAEGADADTAAPERCKKVYENPTSTIIMCVYAAGTTHPRPTQGERKIGRVT